MQKNTLASFLMIGLLISFFTLVSSCNKIREYAQFGTFNFVNQTNYTITFYNKLSPIRYAEYTILPNSVTSIEKTQDAIKDVNSTTYHSPFIGFTPPLIVKFNSVKCLEITPESEHTPLDIKNYAAEKLGERSYKFTYIFTEADYNRATICP
jgi:hypothetical protein